MWWWSWYCGGNDDSGDDGIYGALMVMAPVMAIIIMLVMVK